MNDHSLRGHFHIVYIAPKKKKKSHIKKKKFNNFYKSWKGTKGKNKKKRGESEEVK